MIPLIKNNYIRASGSNTTWTLNIDPLPTKFDNYFLESCKAAEEIYDLKNGPLHVMYSGGADSEYALSVFLHLGMNVTPVIVRLSHDYNAHDIKYAFKFCKAKNLTPRIIDIDFHNFVESGRLDEINKFAKSSIIGRTPACYAIGLIDGSVVCGEGDPHIAKDIETGEWYFDAYQHDYAMENYMVAKGIDGTIFFNSYTPEMLAAYLTDPRMQDLAANRVPGKLGSYSSKYFMYNRHSNFNLEERPNYTGFEKVLESEIAKHPNLSKYLPLYLEYHGSFKVKYYDIVKELI